MSTLGFKESWLQQDHTFPDLLEIENYLADLAATIVLFVESEGSIRKLGAFAASKLLLPKTVGVLNTTFLSTKASLQTVPFFGSKTTILTTSDIMSGTKTT